MKDTEFKALISLLEDDDPNIGDHIEQKLVSMGDQIIPRLEKAWEEENNQIIQTRIEDIIQVIQSKNIIDELIEWKNSDESFLKAWFLVTQYNYPSLDYVEYKHAINRIVHLTFLETRDHMNIAEKLRLVSRMLFERERFKGDEKNLYSPKRYFLNDILEKKLGSPISLSLLYMIICQELSLNVQGIVLPGYFVLTVPGAGDNLYIDAFNKGALFTKKDLTRYLKDLKTQENTNFYEPSPREKILKELIKNIIICYRKQKNQEKTLQWENLLRQIERA